MKYATIKYDFNRPNRNAITVPLNSNYGVAVKVQKDGAAVELSSGQMTIDGVQETGVRDGWLQYDLSSGPAPCTLHKRFEIKTGEASPHPIHFDLTVQEKDLGYFDVPRMQPEPEPPAPGTLILSAFTELSAPSSTVTVSPTAEYDAVSFTLSAADVASLMCVVQVEGEPPEEITGSGVQIQDEGAFEYWYIDPENPDVWTMWDGSETRPEIELKGGNEFTLSSYEQPAGKSMTVEFKLYVRS